MYIKIIQIVHYMYFNIAQSLIQIELILQNFRPNFNARYHLYHLKNAYGQVFPFRTLTFCLYKYEFIEHKEFVARENLKSCTVPCRESFNPISQSSAS